MREVRRGRHIDFETPRGYYLDYSTDTVVPPPGPGRPDGAAWTPAGAARTALGALEIYLERGGEEARARFVRSAEWLIANLEIIPGSFGGWAMPECPGAFRAHLDTGWFSAAVQAECLSTLVRAEALFRLPGAFAAARSAFGAFEATVGEGGLLREIGDPGDEGGLDTMSFLERYPMADRPSMNLSGHVRALWAIFDVARSTGDAAPARLFERGLRGLEFVLERYDTGYWTAVDLDAGWRGTHVADPAGHREHVLLLEILYDMTGVEAFAATARRWNAYAVDWKAKARASWDRITFRVANWPETPG